MEPTTPHSKILIEPLINKKVHGSAIQGKKFKYSFKFTNIANSPSAAFTITKIHFDSAENLDITEPDNKSFIVQTLNPEETKIVEVGNLGTNMYGLATVHMVITPLEAIPAEPIKQIACYQRSPFTGRIDYIRTNKWLDFLYIKTRNEFQQEKNNSRTLLLNILIFMLTIVQVINIIYDPTKKADINTPLVTSQTSTSTKVNTQK